MNNPNYEFCEELDAPEMCVIMNRIWWINNQAEIREILGMKASIVQEQILFIPEATDRTYFMLKWPKHETN